MAAAKRPVFYTGGGVVNSGPHAAALLRELVRLTGFPITSTLMGLGAFPASDRHFLGMLGMHGTYEANLAMHECDVMINLGARFDDRITGRLDAFSPLSKRIHVDIDASSINKNVKVDVADRRRLRPCARGHGAPVACLLAADRQARPQGLVGARSRAGAGATASPTGRPRRPSSRNTPCSASTS